MSNLTPFACSPQKLTDQEVCQKLSDPDQREIVCAYLFKEWINLTQHPIIKYKYPGLTFEDRKDAFVDALIAFELKACRKDFDLEKGSLKSLFFTIYSYKCVDILRHKTNQRNQWFSNLLPLHEVMSENFRNFLTEKENEEEFLIVLGKLAKLSPKSRNLIIKAHLEGWSADALAEEFGYKNSRSATQGLCNAMNNLRKLMNEDL